MKKIEVIIKPFKLDEVKAALSDIGVTGIVFYKAMDAIEYIKSTKNLISLALVDIGLPEMNGLEFSKELHRMAPDIPVVIFTGYLEDNLDTKDTHIIRTFQKPVDMMVLLELIKTHGVKR